MHFPAFLFMSATASGSPSRCGRAGENRYSEYNEILLFRGLGKKVKDKCVVAWCLLDKGVLIRTYSLWDLSLRVGNSLDTNYSLLPLLSLEEKKRSKGKKNKSRFLLWIRFYGYIRLPVIPRSSPPSRCPSEHATSEHVPDANNHDDDDDNCDSHSPLRGARG